MVRSICYSAWRSGSIIKEEIKEESEGIIKEIKEFEGISKELNNLKSPIVEVKCYLSAQTNRFVD